uniref:Prepilin-type N-terminal cleavage/methylation domain-containing protein n=1 Tax=candidate division WOR-3 bacterium TaxID=2052148 RepID=A0A7V4ABA2_UNCW3
MKKGLTLIELLIALTIFGFVFAAILSIYFYQQKRATYVQETSIMQTDAQIAFELIKRDIMHAGLGLPCDRMVVQGINGGQNAPDQITLFGVAFFAELPRARWNPVIALSTGGIIICRNWNEPERDIQVGDTVIILSQFKNLLYPGQTFIVTDVNIEGDRRLITLNNPTINVNAGGFLFRITGNVFQTGITYWLDQDTRRLMRNNDIFLENVEDFQIAYGYDWDRDSIVEEDEFRNDLTGLTPDSLYKRPFLIRVSILVRTEKGIGGFRFPRDNLNIEDRIIHLDEFERNYNRIILTGTVFPRNLKGG